MCLISFVSDLVTRFVVSWAVTKFYQIQVGVKILQNHDTIELKSGLKILVSTGNIYGQDDTFPESIDLFLWVFCELKYLLSDNKGYEYNIVGQSVWLIHTLLYDIQ